MEHRPELDGIRAIALLVVVGFHAGIHPAQGGWIAVDVFFVLSGYLITQIAINEHARRGSVNKRNFWIRRLLRLFPAVLVTLTFGLFFYKILGDDGTFLGYLRSAGAVLGYVENFVWVATDHVHGQFGHTWSLGVEMQFYLVWPTVLIWLLAKGKRLEPVIITGIVISYGLFLLQSTPHPVSVGMFPDAYYLPWTRAFELLTGALLAVRLTQRTAESRQRPGKHWIGWLIGFGFGVALLVNWSFYSIIVTPRVIVWQSPIAVLLTVALMIHLDRVRANGVGKFLAWKPVAWLGLVSYGVYLFHLPVISILEAKTDIPQGKEMFLAALPITLLLASFSYYVFEKPAQQLARRLTRPVVPATPQPID